MVSNGPRLLVSRGAIEPCLALSSLTQTKLPSRLCYQSFASAARAGSCRDSQYLRPLSQCQPTFVPLTFARGGARSFSKAKALHRDHHFDTLKFVQRLKDEGFSEDQSKAMMLVLSDVIEESIQNLTRTMVLREGQTLSPASLKPQSSDVLIFWQTPIEVPTPRKSTSQNSAPSCWPSTPATRL